MSFNKTSYLFPFTVVLFLIFPQAYAQIPHVNNSCYCIEESDAQPNILYNYRVNQQDWAKMAAITYKGPPTQNAEKMEAMAINPVDKVIYAFDSDRFGTIKLGTTLFTLKSTSLKGTGKIKGQVVNNFIFGDVDGLAYDPYTRELWATNRLSGSNSNDLLFKIDPKTGTVIKGIFTGGHDFVEIEESYDGTLGGAVYDVEDIAIHPFTGQLFAIQNQNGPGVITEIDKFDGRIEEEIYDLSADDIEGLGFSGYGKLYGTTGDNSDIVSSLIAIDFINKSTQELAAIDPGLPIGDFESFDCLSDYVDLALEAKKVSQTVYTNGDIVEIYVTVYNQGTIEVNNFDITMHLPSDMTIIESGWANGGGTRRTKTINQTIYANTNHSFLVRLKLNNPTSSVYNVPFEISKVKNNIISAELGQAIALPDVDSTPNAQNEEIDIYNNQINGDGKFKDEDEDDHDIVCINTNVACPFNLVLIDINQTSYNVQNSIQTYGDVNNGDLVEMYAGQEIFFDNGFEIKAGATFTADIQSCL